LYGLWEEINEQIHKAVREKEGRAAEPTAMILNCQSVKRAEGGEAIGFDGGKKVHGRKRVLLTDRLGFARLVKVVAGDLHDSCAGYQLLRKLLEQPHQLPQVRKIFADGGFRGNLEEGSNRSCISISILSSKKKARSAFKSCPSAGSLNEPMPGFLANDGLPGIMNASRHPGNRSSTLP
jgi:hypothetical protein